MLLSLWIWLNQYRLLMSILVGILTLVALLLLRQVTRSRLDFWTVYPIALFLYPLLVRSRATAALAGQSLDVPSAWRYGTCRSPCACSVALKEDLDKGRFAYSKPSSGGRRSSSGRCRCLTDGSDVRLSVRARGNQEARCGQL
ncbi:hypothetical protein MTO96_049339 [Rhipicephalus appendiculatus]